jgi:endo-1,4-beta-xylanase
MSDFYQQIVKAYFEIVPAAQRYGITQWAATDSPDSSSWRGGEPIGLWKLDYTRKPAYAGFADGLKSLK